MQRYGWTLLLHDCVSTQLQRLHAAPERAKQQDPLGADTNPNVRLFAAHAKLIFDAVPSEPNRDEYRQGSTMVLVFRHWATCQGRPPCYEVFRFDWKSRIIVFALVNDENPLRFCASKSDPHTVFQHMPQRGHPPDDWEALVSHSHSDWREALSGERAQVPVST